MATYAQIQQWVRDKYGFTPKTCWIAHVKELSGLKPRIAPNRKSVECRENICPKNKIEPIIMAFRHFKML